MIGGMPFCVSVLLLAPVMTAFGQTFIVKDRQPQAQIIVAEQAPQMTQLAAEELRSTVAKMTGATLQIATAPDPDVAVQIYVGKSAFTDKLGITDDGLKYGAFRMVSGKDYLVLLGNDDPFVPHEPYNRSFEDIPRTVAAWNKLTGEPWSFPHDQLYKERNPEGLKIWERDGRGSFHAVTEFLRMQGVRWYLPDPMGEIVPKKVTIELPQINKTVRPDFALRYPYQYGRMFSHDAATRDEILWQLRMGLDNGQETVGLMGAGLAHGINAVHAAEETKKAHPEYYALYGGKRDTETYEAGRPCLSSQGLFEQNVKYVRAVFDILDAPMCSVMPQDSYVSLCQCDLCKGKDTPEHGWSGQLSDYVWDYVNRVAKEVYKTHPNKKINCFAYGAYLLPPTKIGQLSPNIVVGICQNRRLFYDPAERRKFDELRRGWLAKMPEGNKQFVVWEYYLLTSPRLTPNMPTYFPHLIAQDLRALKGISLGEMVEVYRDPRGINSLAVDHLNLYVTSRCWWDADLDVDALLEEYYTLFYGPAREEMKAFIAYSEQNFMHFEKSAEKIAGAFALLEKARAKAPADSIYAARIAWIADYIQPMKEVQARLAKGRQNVPTAEAEERRKSDVKLDGKLDDKFWEGLRTYNLADLQTGQPPFSPTTFKVAWAEDALYFGIRCEDRNAKSLNIAATKNKDPNLWNGDCIEILLETQTHSYYQLAVNPAGAMIDLDRKKGQDTLWTSGAEVSAFIGDGFWSLEVRVPVAGSQQEEIDPLHYVSGRKPIVAFPWYFNLCRQRIRENGREFSAFSPTGVDHFHELLKFGKLIVHQ